MADAQNASDLVAVGLLAEPVRRRLYEWVVAQGRPVGRDEAARSLAITRALATFHLERLTRAGLLDAGYQRLTGRTGPGAGRPARVYRRSAQSISVDVPPRRYKLAANLFAGALQSVAGDAPPPQLEAAAHEVGRQLVGGRSGDADLLDVLQSAGYEPIADGPTVRSRNCPFDSLVDEHRPLVCGTNLALARGIIDALADESAPAYEARLDSQPGYCCIVFERTEPQPGD